MMLCGTVEVRLMRLLAEAVHRLTGRPCPIFNRAKRRLVLISRNTAYNIGIRACIHLRDEPPPDAQADEDSERLGFLNL